MEKELYDAAKDFVKRYGQENVSDHIINIIVSVMRTRDNIGPIGGSFVQSVVNNDLCGAVLKADNECLKHIKLIALSRNNCFCEM